jgi:hypothetical protein
MPCGACAAKSQLIANNSSMMVARQYRVQQDSGPCEYSVPMLQDFQAKLVWFKDRALYRKHNILPKTMNSYIGIVLSALNTPNRCTYREKLHLISDLVDYIVTIQTT